MMHLHAYQITVGAIILPPARELSLWMRRTATVRGLPASAVYLTVRKIREGQPDKRGRWLVMSCDQTAAWNAGRASVPFTFKARPDTIWPVVRNAVNHGGSTHEHAQTRRHEDSL